MSYSEVTSDKGVIFSSRLGALEEDGRGDDLQNEVRKAARGYVKVGRLWMQVNDSSILGEHANPGLYQPYYAALVATAV